MNPVAYSPTDAAKESQVSDHSEAQNNNSKSTTRNADGATAGEERESPVAASSNVAADSFPSSLTFAPDFKSMAVLRHWQIDDFAKADFDQVELVSHTFEHRPSGIRVTLVPTIHIAHPQFFADVDVLLGYHESVLVEGFYGNLQADATMLPPREPIRNVRPREELDSEGWEPLEMDKFYQPRSWGVKNSSSSTILHAADRYDYERLPWWASVRFSTFAFGWKRDKHCLQQIPLLVRNGYTTFAVPWGVAHMAVMATLLEQNDFTPIASQRLVAFNSVDGPISEAWVRHIRISLRARRWGVFAVRAIPGFLPFYAAVSYVQESFFVWNLGVKPFIPWHFSH